MAEPKPGQIWRNRHTGTRTEIVSVGDVTLREPTKLGQASDGRFIFGDVQPVTRLRVQHTANEAPSPHKGLRDPEDIRWFVQHWRLAYDPLIGFIQAMAKASRFRRWLYGVVPFSGVADRLSEPWFEQARREADDA